MFAVIAVVILAAFYGAFRIIKEAFEKQVNWRFMVIEAVLVILILFFDLTGKLGQFYSDAENIAKILRGQRDATIHGDSTAQKYDSADSARIRHLQDSVASYRSEEAKNKRPILDIIPFKVGPNPTIAVLKADTFDINIGFQNFGSTAAFNSHIWTSLMLKNKGHWTYFHAPIEKEILNLRFPPISGLIENSSLRMVYHLLPSDTMFLVANFSYRDSVSRCFGPDTRIFYWQYGKLQEQPNIGEEEDIGYIKRFYEEKHWWPKKCL